MRSCGGGGGLVRGGGGGGGGGGEEEEEEGRRRRGENEEGRGGGGEEEEGRGRGLVRGGCVPIHSSTAQSLLSEYVSANNMNYHIPRAAADIIHNIRHNPQAGVCRLQTSVCTRLSGLH